jgi:hypothetical protein
MEYSLLLYDVIRNHANLRNFNVNQIPFAQNRGGLRAIPIPGGVPVAMMSPASMPHLPDCKADRHQAKSCLSQSSNGIRR